MTQAAATGLTTPVGRLVGGDVYRANETDMDGKPLLIKNGPKKGQPTKRWYIALAIPKEPGGQHWAHTDWGKIIWARGHADFPQGQAGRPDFAWKIEDGDNTVPNQNNKANANREGYPGNWILRLSSGLPIKSYDAKGERALEEGTIKPGYFVQVYLDVAGNEDGNRNPGVYLNPRMVSLQAFGEEINFGPDPSQAGFGKGVTLPAGASSTPPASFKPPADTPAPAAVSAPAPAPAPVPDTPHSAIAAPPPPNDAPAAPAVPTMTAKAGGVPYKAYKDKGWTDEQLLANGMMTA